ncbi:MAG: tetratricopeptide repeat protein [Betaproteobacteria bacterium AqS2]|uniref:Tetratricopeptide repeat protein n=1 Tax=Candidatus Amphirhobacter heronislandensis TaxID=1732024 RepID=A0A930UDK5_9GAMM|nr:tetratricopeptide repeat protein [Betaproteobacteria bacterium AqS2]
MDDLDHLSDEEEIMFYRAYYASKAGLIDEAESIYRELIEIDPDFGWYYNALGYLLVENRYSRLDEAEILLEIALDLEPGQPAIIHSYGRLLQERGDYEGARIEFEQAKEMLDEQDIDYFDPDYEHLVEIIGSYAEILLFTGRDYELEQFVRDFEDGNPMMASLIRMTEGLYKNEASEELEALIEMMATIDDDSLFPPSFQALILYRKGDSRGARRELAKAEELINDNTLFLELKAYMVALMEVGETGGAENALRFLIDREPDNPWYYSALGYVLADSGRKTEEAVELVEKALELEPDRPEIFHSYAWALHNDGRSAEGSSMAEKALNHRLQMDEYTKVQALVNYGEILWSMWRQEEAIDTWNKARAIDSNHVRVLEIIDQYDL